MMLPQGCWYDSRDVSSVYFDPLFCGMIKIFSSCSERGIFLILKRNVWLHTYSYISCMYVSLSLALLPYKIDIYTVMGVPLHFFRNFWRYAWNFCKLNPTLYALFESRLSWAKYVELWISSVLGVNIETSGLVLYQLLRIWQAQPG